jgi:hypothetical protein
MNIVSLNKTVFEKNQYERTIDTSFKQLISQTTQQQTSSLPTVTEFFNLYEQLFYDIPKTGATNSHEYLVKKSSEYIGYQPTDDTIQALLNEINNLQAENLSLNQQLINNTKNG